MRTIAIAGLLVLALTMRAVWEYEPGLLTCCLFWGSLLVFILMVRQWLLLLPGLACNAAATIANGGFMPSSSDLPHTGIYVALSHDSSLPFLCDRFWGSSLGDFLLLAGLVSVLAFRFQRDRARQAHG